MMNDDSSTLWWLVAVLTGAVGTAMVVYGMRQKDWLSLVFGLFIGGVPMFVESAWAAGLLSALGAVLFVAIRKWM